ncbi:MAG TPA: threonine synthase [Candidatus Saccharimonadales bacterium]
MKFVSLTDPGDAVSFEEALARGIAPGGSLYVPQSVPQLSEAEIARLIGADRFETATIMLQPWLGEEIPAGDLEKIIRQASTFDTPLVDVGDKKVLELFHGPTMAFKDVAARYLSAFMSYFNRKAGRHSTVLVATSGDTGGAIAHGFADVDCLDLVVLYPKGRISHLQREQLRRVAANVRSVEVDGDFNDCQQLVKQAFADRGLVEKLNLTSANSINIGRLLPQIIYYASVYGQLGSGTTRVVVPTGNLGNLSAGLLARAMGVPIAKFLAANNLNDSLARYLKTGDYHPVRTIETMSTAMDVNAPNNLPRFMWIFHDDVKAARAVVQAVRVTDEETVETIRRVYKDTGYLLDPHTAVGWRASDVLADDGPDVITATASPLKFAEEIFEKTGIRVDNEHLLEELRRKPERYWQIDNSFAQLSEFLEGKQ